MFTSLVVLMSHYASMPCYVVFDNSTVFSFVLGFSFDLKQLSLELKRVHCSYDDSYLTYSRVDIISLEAINFKLSFRCKREKG